MTSIFLIVFLVACSTPPARRNRLNLPSKPPLIRVGIVEDREVLEFNIPGKAVFRAKNDNFLLRSAESGHWRVAATKVQPAQIVYRLVVMTTKDRFAAEERMRELSDEGLSARIKKLQASHKSSLPYVKNTAYQLVINKEFVSERKARLFQSSIADKTETEIAEEVVKEARGLLRFTNLDSHYSFDERGPVRVQTEAMQIADVDVGSGFHWESSEHRTYSGTLEFLVDRHGRLTVVDELPVEDYLKGVVPSEMPVSFPLEALKAQAVAARVESFSKAVIRHPNDPFDLCDDVHCQVFSGNTRHAKVTDLAVESTRGVVMVYRNKLAEAFYAGVCGGHTENNDNVWLMDPAPYLRGILDGDFRSVRRLGKALAQERSLKKWVDSSPVVYCNTSKLTDSSYLNYSRKYFRWQVEYSRKVLEKIIRDKTGEDFGSLKDLLPIRRGVSGRLMELEVVGTKKRFKISRELAIRQALSKNTLYSACFYVRKVGKSTRLPEKFVLKGAGWGHGVGMCQVGAAVMAKSGKKYKDILKHYYRGITLEKIY
ncbi:MAG: SpoIID/LytB domain-containing protein [bacterium]